MKLGKFIHSHKSLLFMKFEDFYKLKGGVAYKILHMIDKTVLENYTGSVCQLGKVNSPILMIDKIDALLVTHLKYKRIIPRVFTWLLKASITVINSLKDIE